MRGGTVIRAGHTQGSAYEGGYVHNVIHLGSKNGHKPCHQSTPRAHIHRKYETRHEESDFEDPEARGPLFI